MRARRSIGRVLSLFAGAGGLDLGLERAGFGTVACLDTDPSAQGALQANRPPWWVPTNGDVNEATGWLTPAMVGLKTGELDLIAGGPPCQPFSKAAQWTSAARVGMRDPRAQSIHGMFSLMDTFLPKALLIENVAGFLQGRESAIDVVEERLDGINKKHGTAYELTWKIVDAADYGVPQHRQRAIAIAYRDGASVELPSPTHSSRPVRAWDALWDLEESDKPSPSGYWSGLLPSIPEGKNYLHHTVRGEGEEIFGWRTRYWSFLLKLAKDRPAWTIPASPGPSTGPFHWENRPLSIREQARLQSFPDSWIFPGVDRVQRRLVGNATPPLLAEVLGRAIVSQLRLGDSETRERLLSKKPGLLRSRRRSVPDAESVAAVPAVFRAHIGEKAAHPGHGRGPSPRLLLEEAAG
ncbi:DNA cytosine methyltransferase [Streptomyces griseorubiginosus]|uniref:DNA cytosine methyltransferase n=1 Tax=Streptomyces griseorubiginosus TaxID=67304 RepID=UPI0033C7CE70